MNAAEQLLAVLTRAAEGTRKPGFTVGQVTFNLNQANDTVTGTFTLPVNISVGATGTVAIAAQDWLDASVTDPTP